MHILTFRMRCLWKNIKKCITRKDSLQKKQEKMQTRLDWIRKRYEEEKEEYNKLEKQQINPSRRECAPFGQSCTCNVNPWGGLDNTFKHNFPMVDRESLNF